MTRTGLCHILRVAGGQKLKPVLHLERHYPRLPEEQWSYFPLWKFWTYSPRGLAAAVLWNVCMILRIPCPYVPTLLGWIVCAKETLRDDEDNPYLRAPGRRE